MKLLVVTNLFPTPYDPERGIFTLQLVKRLKKFCEVTVICPLPWIPNCKIINRSSKWAQFSKIPNKYTIDGIEVYSPKYFMIPKLSELKHAAMMAYGIKNTIKKIHKLKNFDAINSHWFYPDSVAIGKISTQLKIPHIATGLGSDVNREMKNASKQEQIITMLNQANTITVVSNNLKNELVHYQIPANKITVIPNGIDVTKFKVLNKKECRKKLNIDIQVPMILYVGRLSSEKSIKTLISATANLISINKNIQVYIIGAGPEDKSLDEQSKSLDLENNVHFVGKVDHDLIGTWMGATDFFCLPSIMEGCPNVILEALGSGCPVIASKVGAIPDIVTESTGILFTPEDISGLTDSIKTAINREWNNEEICESVQYLSWEHAAEKYFNVIKDNVSN